MKDRILLIGKRKSVLIKLTEALSKEGFESDWINNISKAASHHDGKKYSVVAFGRGVKRFDKEYPKQKYLEQNSKMIFVEGLAPIPELFVEQVKFFIHDPFVK